MFKIGQRVVCVDDLDQVRQILKKDKIYVVEGIGIIGGILLAGVLNVFPHGHRTCSGHKPSRFRAVDEDFATDLLEKISGEIESEQLVDV